ncbi:hypothetical protein MTR_8g461970 [Medicago truncatula]|uniref:Uncharacterized protein n=1 Tax=Medicago truncatula TaxID=3880 RepID=A0A072U148_MEDTR|nr:hypothetical protein MTR_8g461970 [Medicago truncatula]
MSKNPYRDLGFGGWLREGKGQKGVEKEERLVKTSRKREKGGKAQESSNVNFGVQNALCELSIYRETSQLIGEKLWEQVIHLVQKYLN